MLEISLLAASALGLAGWFYRRRVSMPRTPGEPPPSAAEPSAAPAADTSGLRTANSAASDRLWKYCYATSTPTRSTARMDELVRNNVVAILQVDALANNYFPRRPTLMSELMRAVDDPGTAPSTLSRMISHDPVLSADILRLANSSLYRVSASPIETVQRAIAVCGVEALRGMLAAAMMRPVFRATSKNFPRLPRALWNRTERAARAAELFALASRPELRFESQMTVLVNALGPLVVYSAIVDVYARNALFQPNAALCIALTSELAPALARRIARDWQMSPRLIEALEGSGDASLTNALLVGELLGSLAFLESQTIVSAEQSADMLRATGLAQDFIAPIRELLASKRPA